MTASAAWLRAHPAAGFVRWSRRSLVTASTLALVETGRVFWWVLDGTGVAVPRWEAYSVSVGLAVATLLPWAVGTAALASDRFRVPLGWLCPVGAVAAALVDHQTLAGEIIYLVVVMSTMHWWSALLARRPRAASVHGAPLRVCQAMISIVFAWATYAKLNPRFMSGAVLSVSFTGPIPVPTWVLEPGLLMAMAVMTVVAEAFLAIGFWLRGLRRITVIVAVLFHAFIVLFFSPTLALFAFTFVMGTGYVLFAAEPWESAQSPLERLG
jgi:hypothetical protein